MISVVDIKLQACNPSLPLLPWRAFTNSPSSLRIANVPTKIGSWSIDSVQINVEYPNGDLRSVECTLEAGGIWVGTVAGTNVAGYACNGYSVVANGVDERGDAISGYMLGCGDVEILDASSIPTPIYNLGSRVRLYSTKPDDPQDGDLWIDGDGSWIIVADGAEVQLAMSEADVGVLVQTIAYPRAEIDTMLEGYAKAAAVDELRSDLDKTTSDLSTTDDKVAKLDGIVDSIQTSVDAIISSLDELSSNIVELSGEYVDGTSFAFKMLGKE